MKSHALDFRKASLWARATLVRFAETDTSLLILFVIFSAISCAALYSASQEDINVVWRQTGHIAIGAVVMLVIALQSPRRFIDFAPWVYLASLLTLTAVIFFGETAKGAQRWLDFGFVRFQPSEMVKLTVPLMLCFIYHVLVPHAAVKHILAVVALVVPMGLIWMQPDLGTMLLIGICGCALIFLAGVHWAAVASLLAVLAAAAPIVWHNLHAYQQQRVLTFFAPELDALGAGYHTLQAKVAIGSGGLWGKGWLNGTQSQLEFVPERTTDFLFAVLAEEFGFIGVMLIIALYLLTTFRGLTIAFRSQVLFYRLLAAALSLSFLIYSFANISMVSGLLPVVGTPLPLLSYGGTSIIMFCATFGILMALSREEPLLLGDAEEAA